VTRSFYLFLYIFFCGLLLDVFSLTPLYCVCNWPYSCCVSTLTIKKELLLLSSLLFLISRCLLLINPSLRAVRGIRAVEVECQLEQMFYKQSTTNLPCDKKSHNGEYVRSTLHSRRNRKQPQEFWWVLWIVKLRINRVRLWQTMRTWGGGGHNNVLQGCLCTTYRHKAPRLFQNYCTFSFIRPSFNVFYKHKHRSFYNRLWQ
jgi:hypothetical protein